MGLHKLIGALGNAVPVCLALALLAACTPATPDPSPAPPLTRVRTATPLPTPRPSPTPTATPVPPLRLSVHWPKEVPPLQPLFVEVELAPPPGVYVTAVVSVTVLDPQGFPYKRINLAWRERNVYVAKEGLQFLMGAMQGDWRLVVHVQTQGAPLWGETGPRIEGQREVTFRLAPIHFHNLAGVLHAGVDLRVPQDFVETAGQGGPWAGLHAWRYGDDEISLWWAPGPTELLLLNNAVVMLEATHDPDKPPRVLTVEAADWQGRPAFLFREDWTEGRPGLEGGQAQAWVVQGPDYWLYVLRMRTIRPSGTAPTPGLESISPLLREVGQTFRFQKR